MTAQRATLHLAQNLATGQSLVAVRIAAATVPNLAAVIASPSSSRPKNKSSNAPRISLHASVWQSIQSHRTSAVLPATGLVQVTAHVPHSAQARVTNITTSIIWRFF